MIEQAVYSLLAFFSVAEVGYTAVFVVCFVSATLLPMGSEPVVFAVVAADSSNFWPVMFIATVANTLGGVVNYAIGYGAKNAFAKERQTYWFGWLERFGAPTMLLSWLPGIGDPLCSLAGWLKMPFWPSVFYMAVGKFVRYVVMTWALMMVDVSVWKSIASILI